MRDLIRSALDEDCMLEPDAVHAYAVHGRAPAVVVAPRNAQEAADVLKLASENGIAVECAGAGTRLRSGNVPAKIELVMTSARLNNIAEYEPADLVIGVEAGTSFPQLTEIVAGHNQFLALDPPGLPQSTIGAAVATSAAGPLRYAHGTPRDQVLGLEIVTGDGRVLHFGGRVVKNVAGYDLVRLIVGSRGTLGFLTRINVRLKPQPEVDRTIAVATSSFERAADVADTVIAAGLDPAALEIVTASLAEAVAPTAAWLVLIRLHGNGDAVRDAEQRIGTIAADAAPHAVDRAIWRKLGEAEARAPLKLRFANLPTLLRDTFAGAESAAQTTDLENPRFAIHAGDGIVRVLADAAPPGSEAAITRERDAIGGVGGTLVIERVPHGMNVDTFGTPEPLRIMSEIKKVFDPAGIMGAGRFVV